MNSVFCSWTLFIIIAFYIYGFNLLYIKDRITSMVISLVVAMFSFKLQSLMFVTIIYFVIISVVLLGISRLVDIKLTTIGIIALLLSTSLTTFGYYNINNIQKTEYILDKGLNKDIIMISDLHYPVSMDKKELSNVVNMVNEQNADIIILNGDIVDENTKYLEMVECIETLARINGKVFFIIGNHEIINYGVKRDYTYQELIDTLNKSKIKILDDEGIQIDNIYLYGVNDKDIPVFDDNLYTIVADHEPNNLMDISMRNVDLHLSGHVHGGQLFGVKFIYDTLGLFDNSYGLKTFNNMISINTSGIAGWGFECKSEGKAEIVKIRI